MHKDGSVCMFTLYQYVFSSSIKGGRKEGKRQISGIWLLPRAPPYIDLLSLDLDFSNNKIEFHNQSFQLFRLDNVKFTAMSVVKIPIESNPSYLVLMHYVKSRTDKTENLESGEFLSKVKLIPRI